MNGVKNFSVNKKNHSLVRTIVGVAVFLFLLFVLNFFSGQIRNYSYQLSGPIQKTFWLAGSSSSDFLKSVLGVSSLKKQNDNLKNENQKLLSQMAFLQSTKEAAQAQSAASTMSQSSGLNLIIAGIIGLDGNDMLFINKGLDDGMLEGMPVINQQNVLFGKIFKTYKNFSKIILISNKDSVVNVKVQQNQDDSGSKISGVVKGSGGLGAYLDLIPINNDINAQDVLVTSAIENSFPKDLLVGKIIQKQKDDQKPFQQAEISLFLDPKATDNLFVIANYKR